MDLTLRMGPFVWADERLATRVSGDAVGLHHRRRRLPGPHCVARVRGEQEAKDLLVVQFDAQVRATVEDDPFGIFLGVAARGCREGDLLSGTTKQERDVRAKRVGSCQLNQRGPTPFREKAELFCIQLRAALLSGADCRRLQRYLRNGEGFCAAFAAVFAGA